jgi:hypothetical protein
MRRKQHFGTTDAAKLQVALQRSMEGDFVFLKAFASVEHLVNCLLAMRLHSKPEELPALGFQSASALALSGLAEEQFHRLLGKAAQIRNRVAHEVEPPPPGVFTSFVADVQKWSHVDRHDCAYHLDPSANPGDRSGELKTELLRIVGHLCHLVSEASELEGRAKSERAKQLQRTRHG